MTGEELYKLRMEAGLTQMELAILLGVQVSTVSHWECGRPIRDVIARGIRAAVQEQQQEEG